MSYKGYAGRRRVQKQQGRGTLQSVTTEGPFNDWLGMPEYYIHTLTVEDTEYQYLTGDKTLDVSEGDYICFRFQEKGKQLRIDKRSLGIAIDPATFQQG
ncbi:hypothetical protein [Spongorhabdus nitratireducens]